MAGEPEVTGGEAPATDPTSTGPPPGARPGGSGSRPPGPDRPFRSYSSTGVPVVVSTPMSRDPDDRPPSPRVPRPTRKERRSRRKERIRRRRTVVGRHPKSTVALVILLALTPVWVSAGSAATNQALGNTPGARLTEWVRDHGGGGHRHLGREHLVHLARPAQGGKASPGRHPGAGGHHHDHTTG